MLDARSLSTVIVLAHLIPRKARCLCKQFTTMSDYITASLNPSQEKGRRQFRHHTARLASPVLICAVVIAVRHSPDIPLQILAGPGSGKTKV